MMRSVFSTPLLLSSLRAGPRCLHSPNLHHCSYSNSNTMRNHCNAVNPSPLLPCTITTTTTAMITTRLSAPALFRHYRFFSSSCAASLLNSFSSSSSLSSSSLHGVQWCSRRCLFGGVFSSKKTEETTTTTAAAPAGKSPLREEALEPVQDRLLDACIKILEMCSGGADGRPPLKEIDSASREIYFDLVDAVLHDYTKTPAQQFDLLYSALCLPAAQEYQFVKRLLLVVMEAITPAPIAQLMLSVDLTLPDYDEESVIRRSVLLRFMRALMGGLAEEAESDEIRFSGRGDAETLDGEGADGASNGSTSGGFALPKGVSEEEALMVFLDDFRRAFPQVQRSPAFAVVEQHALNIALRSKLYTLLGRLCVEMDRERTGKVRLSELQEMANRVLGKEQAMELLKGAVPDAEGKLRYAQLCAILTSVNTPSSSSSSLGENKQ